MLTYYVEGLETKFKSDKNPYWKMSYSPLVGDVIAVNSTEKSVAKSFTKLLEQITTAKSGSFYLTTYKDSKMEKTENTRVLFVDTGKSLKDDISQVEEAKLVIEYAKDAFMEATQSFVNQSDKSYYAVKQNKEVTYLHFNQVAKTKLSNGQLNILTIAGASITEKVENIQLLSNEAYERLFIAKKAAKTAA